MIINTTVYTKCHPDTGKPSASKIYVPKYWNMWDLAKKNYVYRRVKSNPYGILAVAHNYQYPFWYSGFLNWHGYEFIFKNERNLLNRKGQITFMIFVSVQIYSILCGCQCKESNSGISCHSVVCTSYSGVAVQLVQSWTNARARVVLRLHLRQCQSGSNAVMVICNCIKSQLSYFIVG